MFGVGVLLLCYLVGFIVLLKGSVASTTNNLRCSAAADDPKKRVVKMGVIADNRSRMGREQIVAIQMALKHYPFSNSCYKLKLLLMDSPENSAHATATALDLIANREVEAMFGTLTREEVSFIFELHKASMNLPIISLSLSSLVPPPTTPIQTSSFIQMANDITHQLRCIAAIVGNFQWWRVTAIYENTNYDFTTNIAILKFLSDSLRDVNSEIENHLGFSSLDPEPLIEEKLMNLTSNSNRAFVLVQSSTELATLIFKKAKKLNMMTNGYVWIVGDEIANLLDSLHYSHFNNLQGVIGCKIYFEENENSFKEFRAKFRRNYMAEFPEDEGQGEPSIFALRAYDAYGAIVSAMDELHGKQWPKKILESKFKGLSGAVSFKNGILSHPPTFQIINVVGKSYKEIAFWSPEFGFSDKLSQNSSTRNVSLDLWSLVLWPGNAKTAPRGWGNKVLKFGVPTTATFHNLVHVNYNQTDGHGPRISGFCITVFEALVNNLPYFLRYELVPYNGTYESLLQKVHDREFDGAVADFAIVGYRFKYVEFSEPYLENAVVMIVKEKPLKWTQLWLFMRAFTAEMWLLMLSMHMFVSSAIWLIERKHNDALKGFGNMLWFSVSIIFYAHREPVKNGLARLVLGPWLFVILVITASFTASLSSMMTITMSQPSVLDLESVKLKNVTVGCTINSIMLRFLSQASIPPENVRQIPSVDLFPIAFEKGEIQAALFSAPHARIFHAKYCKGLAMLTVFKLVGMGFAFPKGSPLTLEISASIAELLERKQMPDFEANLLSTFNCSSQNKNIDGSGLGPGPFAGLFMISGIIASAAVLFTAAHLALIKLGWIQRPTYSPKPKILN